MKTRKCLTIVLAMGFATAVLIGSAEAACRSVNGHITSEVVAFLPNGDPCPSPIGLCTVGKFIGGIQGKFTFVAEQLIDDPDSVEVEFATGVVELETKDGTLTLKDASAVSFAADGLFGGVQTIVQGTGALTGASGRIRTFGVFIGGCIACDYRGEICTP